MPPARALVVIPTYNERENIGPLIDRIFTHAPNIHVLVVDDHSPDDTAEIVRAKQHEYGADRLQLVVRTEGKAGRGSACIHGFAFARDRGYQAVLEMDADLSHDPADIPRFLQCLSHADVVIGSKYLPGSRIEGWEWYRKLLSRGANLYARMVLRLPVRDYTNGFRCYGCRALALLPDLPIDGTGFTVIPQVSYLLHRRGMRLAEVPITFTNRRRGTSNMTLREIGESFFAILRIRSHTLSLHAEQFLKFAVTGFTNTIVNVALLAFFVEVAHFPVPLSVALADAVAITNAFLMNKRWTFRSMEQGYAAQYMRFLLVYGTSLALNVSMVWFLVRVLDLWYILAQLIAIPACAVWNYLWLHFGVFKR